MKLNTGTMKDTPAQGEQKLVFLAHWVESWNWLLWWVSDLHRNPQHAWRWAWLCPLYFVIPLFYLIGRRAYDVVDRFTFNGGVQGETWLVRNFAWHFVRKSWQELIRQRILRAVLAAQDQGFMVIGLGALIKAEWLTKGGLWIVETLGKLLHTPIIHGDTLTAAAVVERALELITQFKLVGQPVFLTGATSKIGRAVVLSLVQRGIQVRMLTESDERFREIQKEAGVTGRHIRRAASLKDGAGCGLWITGKAVPSGKALLRHVPFGATVLNFSVPDPLSEHVLRRRPDVMHIDGGLLGYDPARTTLRFTMRLTPGTTYACHAATILHAIMRWSHNEVGPVRMDQIGIVWRAAMEAGFFLPPLTSFLRPVQAAEFPTIQQPSAFSGAGRQMVAAVVPSDGGGSS